MRAVVINSPRQIVRVSRDNSIFFAHRPITLRNPITPSITSLDDLPDVDSDLKEDGAGMIWDADTNKYIIRPLLMSDVHGNLDGGTF